MARRDPLNESHYWWDRHLTGLSLMHADFTTHEYPQHTHDALVIAITEQGGSVVKSRGELQDATPSTLFVFNPEEPHGGWMGRSERWRYRSLYLTRKALDRVARELGIAEVPYFTRNTFADRDLIAAFQSLHETLQDGREVMKRRCYMIDPQTLDFMKPDDVKVNVTIEHSFGNEVRMMPFGLVTRLTTSLSIINIVAASPARRCCLVGRASCRSRGRVPARASRGAPSPPRGRA